MMQLRTALTSFVGGLLFLGSSGARLARSENVALNPTSQTFGECVGFFLKYERAIERRNLAEILDLYQAESSATAIVNGQIFRGPAGLRDRFADLEDLSEIDTKFTLVSYRSTSPDRGLLAMEVDAVTTAQNGQRQQWRGGSTFWLEKIDDTWRIVHEHSSLEPLP